MIRGRPVLFLAVVLGGWTALRVTMAFTVPEVATERRQRSIAGPVPRPPAQSMRSIASLAIRHVGRSHDLSGPISFRPPQEAIAAGNDGSPFETVGISSEMRSVFAEAPRPNFALDRFAPGAGLAPVEAGLPRASERSRWAGSGWILWRNDDNAAGYARGPRLGGSQAGVRIDYALAPDSALRPTLYGRLSSALRSPAAIEVATGFAIRPKLPLPLIIAVERREGLSPGGRSAFAILAAGGINPVEIGGGLRLDGYGQAGLVGFRQRDAFADGRLTVERPLAGAPDIALGAGIWGGVQPDVSRLDIGPQASLRFRLGNATLRVGAEWRERVAGNASPSSGPALSIGTDF